MSQVAIVFIIVIAALALAILNRVPTVIVGIGVSLAPLFTAILRGNEAVTGFGDPTGILIAGLFLVVVGSAASLSAAGWQFRRDKAFRKKGVHRG